MNIFGRRNKNWQPSYGETLAMQGEGKPTGMPTEYEPSSNIQHLYSFDENVLDRILGTEALKDSAPAFGATSDTNFLDKQSVEVLQIKIRKAFKYLQLRMTRRERRELLPSIKFLEANAYARAWNNMQGNKIKTLTQQVKVIKTGEVKKGEI